MKKQELFNNVTEGFLYQRQPQQMGLYDAAYEHDACGVGMLVNIHGEKSHDIVESALKVLENMRHRGAEGADNKTGDGAGIMLQIPHEFILLQGIPVPEKGRYGTGLLFLPKNEKDQAAIFSIIIEEIEKEVLNIAKDTKFNTFKVETDRADKSFPISSMDFSRRIGALILKNIDNIKVDVHNPEYLLKIEIREDYTYIYHKEISASGGYPVGVAGKGLLMLSGGIDSPVAAYLAMKRGIKVECVYFESPPHTSIMAKNKVKKLVELLTKYEPSITLHVIKFTDIQEAIYKNIDPTYMITIMRRMMYRISEKIMEKTSCLCLINGESVGQVASQTLTSMRVINSVTNVPVIRPVACLDKLEIIDISKKIGTYETSILPYEDCCTIFLPKHPVINPDIDKAVLYEKSFDYESLINAAIENEEVIKISNKKKDFDI